MFYWNFTDNSICKHWIIRTTSYPITYKSGQPWAHQRNAIPMAFRWWAVSGQRMLNEKRQYFIFGSFSRASMESSCFCYICHTLKMRLLFYYFFIIIIISQLLICTCLPNGAKHTSTRCRFVGTESQTCRLFVSQISSPSELQVVSFKSENFRLPIKASIENAVAFDESCGFRPDSYLKGLWTFKEPSDEFEFSQWCSIFGKIVYSYIWNKKFNLYHRNGYIAKLFSIF